MTQKEMPDEIWIKRGGHREAEFIHTLPIPDAGTKYVRADLAPSKVDVEVEINHIIANTNIPGGFTSRSYLREAIDHLIQRGIIGGGK